MGGWPTLALAIVAEVIATTALKASQGFTRPGPGAIVVVGYAAAFWLLAITLKRLPVGIAYAVWSGAGTVLIALIAWAVFRERIGAAGWLGIALIIAGVAVLNLYSRAGAH